MSEEDARQIKRLIKIGTIAVCVTFILGIVIVSGISLQIASWKDETKKYIDDRIALSIPDPIKASEVAKEVSKIIDNPKSGESPECLKEKDKCRGKNGENSISTHTIVEKETIVKETIPGTNGKDAPKLQIAKTSDGKQLWKYDNETKWQEVPIVDILTGLPIISPEKK